MSAEVQPMQEAAIRQYAKQLHLPTLGGQFARLAEQAVKEQQSHLSYLEALMEGEVEERGRKAMARRIQEAHFPAVKTLEEFDFQCAPHLPVPLRVAWGPRVHPPGRPRAGDQVRLCVRSRQVPCH